MIAPKAFGEFTPDEFLTYVREMQFRPREAGAKSTGVTGLTVRRLKSGKLSVRRTKARTFEYVTHAELEQLAREAGTTQTELWNCLRGRDFILAKTRMDAETIYSNLKTLPF
jgi:hypothetical protein